MSRLFLVNIDLGGNQLLGAVIEVLASAPSHAAGRVYYDSSLSALRVSNGTAWTTLGAGGSDASTLNSQAGSYYLARANHTGTQTASTISDFDTQVRTSRLDQLAAPTGNVNLNSQKITGLADPTASGDAATKSYVDAVSTGLDVKASVRAATTAALATNSRSANVLTASANGTLASTDGVSLAVSDRLLVKNEATGANNGIYTVTSLGSGSTAWQLTRATDADSSAEVTPGMFTFVEEGTTNADTGWVLTTNASITVNTTALTFAQFSGAGTYTAGTGLTLTGGVFAIDTGNGYGSRKVAANVGDGSSTAITVTHNLSTRDVTVNVYQAGSPYAQVFPDIEASTTSAVIVRFATAPSSNQYRVVIVG